MLWLFRQISVQDPALTEYFIYPGLLGVLNENTYEVFSTESGIRMICHPIVPRIIPGLALKFMCQKPLNPKQTGMGGHPTWHMHTKPLHLTFIVSNKVRIPKILDPQTYSFLTRKFLYLLKTSYNSLPFCPTNEIAYHGPHRLF